MDGMSVLVSLHKSNLFSFDPLVNLLILGPPVMMEHSRNHCLTPGSSPFGVSTIRRGTVNGDASTVPCTG